MWQFGRDFWQFEQHFDNLDEKSDNLYTFLVIFAHFYAFLVIFGRYLGDFCPFLALKCRFLPILVHFSVIWTPHPHTQVEIWWNMVIFRWFWQFVQDFDEKVTICTNFWMKSDNLYVFFVILDDFRRFSALFGLKYAQKHPKNTWKCQKTAILVHFSVIWTPHPTLTCKNSEFWPLFDDFSQIWPQIPEI